MESVFFLFLLNACPRDLREILFFPQISQTFADEKVKIIYSFSSSFSFSALVCAICGRSLYFPQRTQIFADKKIKYNLFLFQFLFCTFLRDLREVLFSRRFSHIFADKKVKMESVFFLFLLNACPRDLREILFFPQISQIFADEKVKIIYSFSSSFSFSALVCAICGRFFFFPQIPQTFADKKSKPIIVSLPLPLSLPVPFPSLRPSA